jgi:hypothetical protein
LVVPKDLIPFVFFKFFTIFFKMQHFKLAAFLFFCLLAFVQNAQAQSVVGTLSIQGSLKQNNGQAVDDGAYGLTFKLYTAQTGGTAIWTEVHPSVNIVGGIYSVELGKITPLTPAFNVPYWLGITLGSSVELQPRTALTPAPYALGMLGSAAAYYGDVQAYYQATDFPGWVKLDGRAKNTLTAEQQARATALGIGANLPNTSGRAIVGAATGQTVGQTTTAGTLTIAQNNLPDVDLTSSSNASAHTHTVSGSFSYKSQDTAGQTTSLADFNAGLEGFSQYELPNFTSSVTGTIPSGGAHTHTVALNGGVTQQAISVPPPAAIALNYFIFLGM